MEQKLKQDTVNIGRNLRRLRKAKGLTQGDMARLLQLNDFDVSRSVYSKMEIGLYNIKINELIAIKKILRVKSYEEFFEGLENEVNIEYLAD